MTAEIPDDSCILGQVAVRCVQLGNLPNAANNRPRKGLAVPALR